LEGAAEFLARIEVTQRGQRAGIVEMAGLVNPIVARQAGAVGQQVAQCASFVCDGVLEPELGQDLTHRHVPSELALIHEQGEPGGGKGLRDRADRKQRRGLDTRSACDVFEPEGLQQSRRISPQHRQRQTGDVPFGHHVGDQSIEIGDKRSDRRSGRHRTIGHGGIPYLEQQKTPRAKPRSRAGNAPASQSIRRTSGSSRLKARRSPSAASFGNPR
jgi:hypothetical protein